ncbi:hypothetical protein Unana1_06861 [Umbelopsis nana]
MGRLQDKQFIGSSRKRNEKTKTANSPESDREKLEGIFCPPLDTSLIEAIWNDTKSYEASFEVLTLLAKDATTQIEPALEQVPQPEDVSAHEEVTASTPEATPNLEDDTEEISSIEFLKRCFPDQPQSQLESVLTEQSGNVQSAIDVILNSLFLQEEEAEEENTSDNSDSQSSRNQGSPDRFLSDLSGDDGPFSSKKTQKAQRQARKTQAQRSKKQVIWDSGGLNAASIRSGNYPDPIMLAPVEPNRWLEYQNETKELIRLFPRLSKTVINTTVRRSRGNLLECVDQLTKLTNTSPLHLRPSDWQEHRKIEKVIELAKELLPGRDKDEIRRLSVGAVNQGKIMGTQENGELTQMVVDLVLTRERDREKEQIMIEEQLKELALYDKDTITYDPVTGEVISEEFPTLANERLQAKIKAAQAAKEIRTIPEYLLIDNTEHYVDDDPEKCRDIAFDLILQRNEAYRKAASAYRRARGKTNGEGGVAFYYSDEGRKMDVAAKEWNMRAARAIIREHRLNQNDDHLLDLHGLTIAEAVELVREGVNQWWSRSTMRAGRTKIKPLTIVTGLGRHSDHGQSRLYPAVLGLLTREGWKVDAFSRGSLLVTGLANGDKRKG